MKIYNFITLIHELHSSTKTTAAQTTGKFSRTVFLTQYHNYTVVEFLA